MRRGTIAQVLGWTALLLGAAGCGGQTLSPAERAEMLMARSARLEEELFAARRQLAQLTKAGKSATEATEPGPDASGPEDPFRAVAVRFGKYTGGLDTDGQPGDERLKVILEPLDAEGDVVKRAGALVLEAFEAASGEPRLYAQWEWSREELARTWLSGPGLYGYVLKLDWRPEGRPPESGRLMLRARFTTLSEEVLSAEKEVPIRRGAAAGPERTRGG